MCHICVWLGRLIVCVTCVLIRMVHYMCHMCVISMVYHMDVINIVHHMGRICLCNMVIILRILVRIYLWRKVVCWPCCLPRQRILYLDSL